MLQPSPEFQAQISFLSRAFGRPTWLKVQLLLYGAILCPGSRTVCNVLRTLGLSQESKFDKYHAVLYRAKWSSLQLANYLLAELLSIFVAKGEPLVFGIDETVERRWGRSITKRGIYRDAVRSSRSHFVKCSGLRWMSLMLLVSPPWLGATMYWALPVLTALCPSKRYFDLRDQPRKPKTLGDWSRQILLWLARVVGPLDRDVYLVGDGAYATYDLMMTGVDYGLGVIARMKLNAQLYHLPPLQPKGKRGRKPKKGKRILGMKQRLSDKRIKWQQATFTDWYGGGPKTMLITTGVAIWADSHNHYVLLRWVLLKDPDGKLEPVLLACSEPDTSAEGIVSYFVRRWRVEVTFAEVRRHLGVETQRQWSDKAIERTTPALMGLKSLVCLLAVPIYDRGKLKTQETAWYKKTHLTFSDVLTAVRGQLWTGGKLTVRENPTLRAKLSEHIDYIRWLLAATAA